MGEAVEETEEFCAICGGLNVRRLDRRTGRLTVTYPSTCATKAACAQRISGFPDVSWDPRLVRAGL